VRRQQRPARGSRSNPHRRLEWIGGGWWRRKEWVTHEPRWVAIVWSTVGVIYACHGHRLCPAIKVERHDAR
jgi:hypothetical protein